MTSYLINIHKWRHHQLAYININWSSLRFRFVTLTDSESDSKSQSEDELPLRAQIQNQIRNPRVMKLILNPILNLSPKR